MIRTRLRTLALLSAMSGLPMLMAGCLGASDDKQGSSLESGTGGTRPNGGLGVMSTTQEKRNDTGEPKTPGTGRVDDGDRTRTGGLGTGSHAIPGKSEAGSGPANSGMYPN